MKTLLIILLSFATFSTHAVEPETVVKTTARVTQIAALAALYADWHTTREAGKYYNTINPTNGMYHKEVGMHGLFGEHPSPGEINSYFISYALVNLAINKWAHPAFRVFFNTYQFSLHWSAYDNNVSLGLSRAF